MFKKVGDLRQFFREKFVLKKEDEKNKKCLQGCCSYHDGLNDSRTACEDGFVPDRLGGVTVKKDLVAFNFGDLGKGVSKATSVITDKTIEAGGFVKNKAVEVGSFMKDKAVEGIEKTVELINQGMELIEEELENMKEELGEDYETVKKILSEAQQAMADITDETADVTIRFVTKILASAWLKYLMGYKEANMLWEHSLQNEPCNLYFYQDDSLSQKIMQSEEYNQFIDDILQRAEEKDLYYFNFDSATDNKLFKIADKKKLIFIKDGNLFYSLHGLSGDIQIKGEKDLFNNWHLEVSMSDEYDFDHKNKEKYSDFAIIVNNIATEMEKKGRLVPYWIYINFKDIREGGPLRV